VQIRRDAPDERMPEHGTDSKQEARHNIWDMAARSAIPPQRHETPVACPDWFYNNRNRVGRLRARLKEWRAAASLTGVLYLAAILDCHKR
jgi:hypothetical protein